MNASNLRAGPHIAEGGSSRVFNVTDTDTNVTYAMKTFHDQESLAAEIAAYERIKDVPALRNRVPHFYGVANFPPQTIFLEKVDGEPLDKVIYGLSSAERDDMKRQLTETLDILHRDARLYHRGIGPGKILVQDGQAKLLGFGLAVLQGDVDEELLVRYGERDQMSLSRIFWRVASDEATQHISNLIERLRDPNHGIENSQYKLSQLLSRIGHPSKELLQSIIEVVPNPAPVLVLPFAHYLSQKYAYQQAVNLLLTCSRSFEPKPPLSSATLLGMLLQMKEDAALCRAQERAMMMEPHEMDPSLMDLFEAAIDFYLRWPPKGAKPRTDADEKVLKLRLELAVQLTHGSDEHDAMVVCERALARAIETGRPINEGIVRDFQLIINKILRKAEHRLDRIFKAKQLNRERKSEPWSKHPEYEDTYLRAEKGLDTCYNLLHRETSGKAS